MMEIVELWDTLRQARRQLVRASAGGIAPPRQALSELEAWSEEAALLPDGVLTAEDMAQAWGELQLVMIECGPGRDNGEHAQAWQRVRRSAEEGFLALLARQEWSSLHADFRDEVLPQLADAVGLPHAGRVERCVEAARRLRALAHRTSGQPHAWRLRRVADMQYPHMTREGWLACQDIDFTWPRAAAVMRALCEEMLMNGPITDPLVVSYDSRVHADQLAAQVTEIATAYGIHVHLAQRDTPTPAALDYLTVVLGEPHTAGLVECSAGHLPAKDPGAGRYTGHAYQGIRYYLPSGHPLSADMAARISRRAAEHLLHNEEAAPSATAGMVTVFNPFAAYCRRLVDASGYTVLTGEGNEEIVQDLLREFLGHPDTVIIIDEMHGATREYFRALCDTLCIRYEVLHGERDPVFGELGAADPEPPFLGDLSARVREVRGERTFALGLAFSADGQRLGVVDETGSYLSPGIVLALLSDYLLSEGYPGEAAGVARSRTATRLLDRLAALPEYADRTTAPNYRDHLPPYLHAPGYRRLAGDPQALAGSGVFLVDDALLDTPDPLLIAGDARGAVQLGTLAGADGLRAALFVLQLCAVRKCGLRALWQQLQQRIGTVHAERLKLTAPDTTRRALLNRYLERYSGLSGGQLSAAEYQLGGCTVRYAGGRPDQFVEWALLDDRERPAYLSISQLAPEPALRVDVEAPVADVAHRLLLAVGERLEQLLNEQLHRAGTPWQVVEVLAHVTSPLTTAAELPGTLNCRLAGEAYARLQELARPGREAPELMRFVTDRLRELEPEKARVLAACHLGEQPQKKKVPPPPRVHWESEEL